MAKTQNTTSIGFEDKIWQAADKLRGNLSASQYESVVLGIIFLKYISDKFEQKYEELKADEWSDEEDMDEYLADNVFFVPQEARWGVIANAAHTPEIGLVIDRAMKAIEDINPQLKNKNILPKNYAREELDKGRLGDVVDIFTNVAMHDSGEDNDLLGRVYEYCIQKFAIMEGKNAGAFYTPSCIVRTIVEILQPYEGRVYDPCCGSGGMFVQSAKFIKRHQKDINKISIYGQEFNTDTWKMAQMNLAIRGLEGNFGPHAADTYVNDLHPTLKADFIMANPPFNMEWPQEKLTEDPRWHYGLPPASNANFAWIQHMVYHLSPKGQIGLVLANGALSSQSGGEGEIRKALLEDDLVEGIISMPNGLFYNVTIPVTVWIFNRRKLQPGKVLFVDARNMGKMVTRTVRELTDATVEMWKDIPADECDVQTIARTFEQFRMGMLQDQKGFCAIKTLADIKEQDYILTPGRYVGIAEDNSDTEPFADKMARLTASLSQLFAESREQEEEIRKQLKTIGWEV